MRFNSIVKRISSAALMLSVLVASLMISTGPVTVSAKSVSQIKKEISEAQQESAAIKKKIAKLEASNATYEEQQQALKEQIAATQKEIDLYQLQIDTVKAEIDEKQKDIDEKQKELDEKKELFKKRLVAIYTSGSNSGLSVLLSADDFADYLAKSELLARVSDHDNQLMSEINDAIAVIEEEKAKIESSKKELDGALATVQQKQDELESQYKKVQSITASYNKQINSLEDDLSNIEEDTEQLTKDLAAAQQALSSSGGGRTGTANFIWPVPGYYKISSKYGYRTNPVTGKYKLHGGVDISSSGIYGAKIVAADDGTVILSRYEGSYGYCVFISHGTINGKSYVTVYAHMKSASPLKAGANVSKGDVIGYVGSTGNSTGPHLHFEIRVNGDRKNPMNWFN